MHRSLLVLEYLEHGLAPPGTDPSEVSKSQKRKFRKLFKKYFYMDVKGLSYRKKHAEFKRYGNPKRDPSPLQKSYRARLVHAKMRMSIKKKYNL